ncbi:MAG: hypothetical protein JSV79_03355 [Armatimonadota bacterium]|nr:MAG: hypothetical protein JSV79_03355 [Armatimonadota bacterium]
MMVVRGQAGTGKTIFVADFVLGTLWQDNHCHVAVFDIEQGEEQARGLVQALGHLELPPHSKLTGETGEEPNAELTEQGLWYHDLWACDWDKLRETVYELIGVWRSEKNGKRKVSPGQGVIVIDSLNALGPSPVDRAELRSLRVSINRDEGWWLVVVCEADPGEDRNYGYLDYETDILLWLTAERPGPKEHSRRMLEIVKCRNAAHIRGRHHFAISSPDTRATHPPPEPGEPPGPLQFRVFPSLASNLNKFAVTIRAQEEEARERRPRGPEEPPRERSGISGLTEMLGDGLPVASATAYVGPPGSRKGPCAFHFALQDDGELKLGRTLIMSLGSDEPAVAALASDYKPLRQKLLQPDDKRRFRSDERVVFRMLPPGYASAAACVSDIVNWLDRLNPDRVIITDLSQLKQQFPVVETEADPFLSTLVQLFRAKRVTALFVETTPEEPEPRTRASVWSRVGGLVDNLVEFRHLFFYGAMHLGVSVTRRDGAAAEKGFWELRTREGARPEEGRTLEAADNLHGFTDLLTREPRHAPLNIYVYADTELQRTFNKRLAAMIGRALPGVPHTQRLVRTFGAGDACYTFRALEHATDRPQPDIRIATIDEFWVRRLLTDGPSKLSKCPKELYKQMVNRWIVQEPTHVPWYLNVGLIAALGLCDDAMERFDKEYDERAGTSWADFWNIAKQELKRIGQEHTCAFDFGKDASESWSCLLLEVLSSAGTFVTCPESGDVQRFQLSPKEAVEELSAFCELFWLGRDQHPEAELQCLRAQYLSTIRPTDTTDIGDEQGQNADGERTAASEERLQAGHADARTASAPAQDKLRESPLSPLFRRLWYAELTQLLDTCPELRHGAAILRPPGKGDRGQAMRGEWYWCVISGGASDRTGWEIVNWLTAEAIATRQYVAGIGLPAHSFFYKTRKQSEGRSKDAEGVFPAADGKRNLTWVTDKLWKPGLRRARIAEYPWIAPLLANLLFQILCLGAEQTGKQLRQTVAQLLCRAEHQINAISTKILRGRPAS